LAWRLAVHSQRRARRRRSLPLGVTSARFINRSYIGRRFGHIVERNSSILGACAHHRKGHYGFTSKVRRIKEKDHDLVLVVDSTRAFVVHFYPEAAQRRAFLRLSALQRECGAQQYGHDGRHAKTFPHHFASSSIEEMLNSKRPSSTCKPGGRPPYGRLLLAVTQAGKLFHFAQIVPHAFETCG